MYLVNRTHGIILSVNREEVLLEAIFALNEMEINVDDRIYPFLKVPLNGFLHEGYRMNLIEVLRDFNGWSWNPMPKLMTNINFNILYQTLLLLLGNNFMESWQFQLQLDGKNTNWLFEARKTIAKKYGIVASQNLFSCFQDAVIGIYANEDTEFRDYLDNTLINCKSKIREMQARGIPITEDTRIFTLYKLLQSIGVERNKNIDVRIDERKLIIEYLHIFFDCFNTKIKSINDNQSLERAIYELRYISCLPVNSKYEIKDVANIAEDLLKCQKSLITKACNSKLLMIYSADEELNMEILRNIFRIKIMNLSQISFVFKFERSNLIVEVYDGGLHEFNVIIPINGKTGLTVKLNKRVRLWY